MEKHLCIPIDRHTKEQLGEEMVIEAADWYYARHIAATRFWESEVGLGRDWVIDSMKLDD